eukprot:6173138-Pleurochrysis_carterae.AAC.1
MPMCATRRCTTCACGLPYVATLHSNVCVRERERERARGREREGERERERERRRRRACLCEGRVCDEGTLQLLTQIPDGQNKALQARRRSFGENIGKRGGKERDGG